MASYATGSGDIEGVTFFWVKAPCRLGGGGLNTKERHQNYLKFVYIRKQVK